MSLDKNCGAEATQTRHIAQKAPEKAGFTAAAGVCAVIGDLIVAVCGSIVGDRADEKS